MDNAGSFMKGLFFGTVAGAVAGVLLAPKSGKETKKELMEMVEKLKDQAGDAYDDAMDMVNDRVKDIKAAGKKIDQKKYMDIVDEVVAELKDDGEVASSGLRKLSVQLKKDWKKVQEGFVG